MSYEIDQIELEIAQVDQGFHSSSLSSGLAIESSPSPAPSFASELPPVDGGRGAWTYLASAFLVEALVWGFPDSYGVFLKHYQTHPPFSEDSTSLLPLTGVLTTGIMYISSPAFIGVMNRWPEVRGPSKWLGVAACSGSLLAASWATKAWHLVLTQGVLYGLGGSLLYQPTASYTSEWFVAKRGLALGVVFAGTAVGGLVLPPIIEALLSRYGVAITLRALALGVLVLLLITMPFLRGRLPASRAARSGREHGQGWEWNSAFFVFVIANTLQGLGYFIPSLYLPTYAESLRLPSSVGSAAVSCLNGAGLISRLLLGALSDRFSPYTLATSSLLLSAMSVFTLWGLSTSLPLLIVFSLLYGFFAAGYPSLWAAIIGRDTSPSRFSTLFGILCVSRGLGNLLTAPVSTGLLKRTLGTGVLGGYAQPYAGSHSGTFGPLIVWVGALLAGAGLVSAGIEGVQVHRLKVRA